MNRIKPSACGKLEVMTHLVIASGALEEGLIRRSDEAADNVEHAVEIDDKGWPAMLTIAREEYEPHWLRLNEPWDTRSEAGKCPKCWDEFQRRAHLWELRA